MQQAVMTSVCMQHICFILVQVKLSMWHVVLFTTQHCKCSVCAQNCIFSLA